MSFMVYIYLLAGLSYAYIGIATYLYDSSKTLNRVFLIMCLDLALWALMLTLINAVADAETATAFRRLATLFWSAVYCLLLHFFLILIKKDRFLNRLWVLFLFYSPALISIYLYYYYIPVTAQDIVKTAYGWAYLNPLGKGFLWDNFLNIYYLSYSLASIILLYIWGKQSIVKRGKMQAKVIVSTFTAALLIGSVTDIILPNLGIPLLPPLGIFFIMIPILGLWYSIKRYRLMNLSPENVVLDVIKTMQEGMIITNQNKIIQNINMGAEEILGYAHEELKNREINVIFSEESDLAKLDVYNTYELLLKTKGKETLPVLISSTTLSDEWGEPYGSVFIFQDLTEIRRMQSKLQAAYDQLESKVEERTKELNTANFGLRTEIEARIDLENEIMRLAYYDHLTGLPNRRLFKDRLEQKILDCLRNELLLAVMFLDLDSFKTVNDTMGHTQGDQLLKQVAERLASTLRINDTIARVGGDEFLILVQMPPCEGTTNIVADKLMDTFRQPFILAGNEIYITASMGIAIYPIDGEEGNTLIKNADIAMYRAKESGKNKYEICTLVMKDGLVEVMKMTNHLYRALENKELELYYQPQVDTNFGHIVGFEALIRWNHPELGLILPGQFIAIAEKTGLIVPIGEWVLETACRQNKAWQDQGIIAVPMAINISVKQMMDNHIVAKVAKILEQTGLEHNFLELEITESVLMKEVDLITEILEQLNRLGVRISIDDFGTEYSSLNYLKQLPIDRIKIAMTFVQGITFNPRDEAIINAIIALANNLNIDTIAEGVENRAQLEYLQKANCNAFQGFYAYRPMTAGRIEELFGAQGFRLPGSLLGTEQ